MSMRTRNDQKRQHSSLRSHCTATAGPVYPVAECSLFWLRDNVARSSKCQDRHGELLHWTLLAPLLHPLLLSPASLAESSLASLLVLSWLWAPQQEETSFERGRSQATARPLLEASTSRDREASLKVLLLLAVVARVLVPPPVPDA